MIYFDYTASTPVAQVAVDAMTQAMIEQYANPSALHRMGFLAEQGIHKTSERFAKWLGCDKNELIYTSGGTESINTALFGIAGAYHRSGKTIVTTPIEHAATTSTLKVLEDLGYTIKVVPVDAEGFIIKDALLQALDADTVLLTMIHVNNEIGSIQPVETLAKAAKALYPNLKVHIDGVQAFGKTPLSLTNSAMDAYSLSAHKFYGPKGIGLLYIKKGTLLKPLMYGGNHQHGLRAGTQNVPGIMGMAAAAGYALDKQVAYHQKVTQLKACLLEGLNPLEDVIINSPFGSIEHPFAPHIVNLSFLGLKGEVLLHALEEAGMMIATGSACSSNKKQTMNPVLKAMGRTPEAMDGTVRISLDDGLSTQDVEALVTAILKLVPMLRRFKRK